MVAVNPGFDQRGLPALQPRQRQNGRFFVRYSAPHEGILGDGDSVNNTGCTAGIIGDYMPPVIRP